MVSSSFFTGKRILVTGGTGTIGSEIVRQLRALHPQVIRIYSRDETRQYELIQEFHSYSNGFNPKEGLRFLIGDVRDAGRLKRAMEGCDVVFHAAALKHVPICEYNPFEAVYTNVIGTKNVIEAALDAGVQRMVMISTDKAVNPLNTMGATKLLAERIAISSSQYIKKTKVAIVRFGNVLGSRGSIIPILVEQIRRGDPVTITDERMCRFMMSIREAVGLVLEVSQREIQGGETCILKMPALKIRDLIDVVMSQVAPRLGKNPKEIKVVEAGIRPGEKLEEELLNGDELRRVKVEERLFVVQPHYRPITPDPVPESQYRSSQAPLLSCAEIKELLVREKLI